MYGTKTALAHRYDAATDKKQSTRRQGVAWLGLILPLFILGADVQADDQVKDIQSLEQVLKESGKALPRFHMQSGQSFVGRFIRIETESVTIRRPTGGLRSVPMSDIDTIEIVNSDGKFVRGRLTALDDGIVGWTIQGPSSTERSNLAANTTKKSPIETGGPLIKLPSEEMGNLPRREVVKANADIKVREDNAVETGLGQDAAVDGKQLVAIAPSTENDDGIGSDKTIHLEVHAEPVSETENVMYFRLSLSAPPEESILIIYSILNGSAMADIDYKHRQGVLVFAPGEQQKALAVEIIDDKDVEDVETFQLFVTADPSAVTIDTRTVEASIQDNDP